MTPEPKQQPKKPAPVVEAPKPPPEDDVIRDRDFYTINPATGRRTKVKRK